MADKGDLFVGEVWGHEATLLGLGGQEFIIPTEQVKAQVGIDRNGDGRILIYVHNIEVTRMDHVTKQVDYRITGLSQLTQKWDLGGSYLSPEQFDANSIDSEYA
jgi:hypothetical protein